MEPVLILFNPPELSAVVALISLVVSTLAFGFSIYNFGKTRTATLYSDIDARYFELLKLGIANPSFVDPALTHNYKEHFKRDDLPKYERYAFAAWNIVETIVDRRDNGELARTWDPVIREENRLHRTWLNNVENQHKFKNEFWKFMIVNEGKNLCPCPSCQKLRDNSECPRCSELRALVQSGNEIPIVSGSHRK